MESRVVACAIGVLFFAVVVVVVGEIGGVAGSTTGGSKNCKFPAVFNFGDSNSDTGSASVAFGVIQLPFGMSSSLKDRYSDGQLIIDYITENLGLPYLESPLKSLGTNFRHGANFAVGGSKISPLILKDGSGVPLHLDVQVSQFFLFKSRSIAFYKQLRNNSNNPPPPPPPPESNLPEPEVFSRSLYTIDIGQNDVNTGLYNSSIPIVVSELSSSLQRLLRDGAKYIWVHNTGPQGCLPSTIGGWNPKGEDSSLDKNGCVNGSNRMSQDFNQRLKQTIYSLRAEYPRASITYVDVYSAKYSLIANANKLGFQDPFGFCCGGKNGAWCGARTTNQTILASVCTDPSKYISWDGVHYTQAANRFVAKLIVNGSFSDPPLPIAEAC